MGRRKNVDASPPFFFHREIICKALIPFIEVGRSLSALPLKVCHKKQEIQAKCRVDKR